MPQNRLDTYIDRVRQLAPLVREHADRSEREAQLAPAIVEAFHDACLFRILLPAEMGGGELTLPESFRDGHPDVVRHRAVLARRPRHDPARCLEHRTLRVVGRVLFGLDAGTPII